MVQSKIASLPFLRDEAQACCNLTACGIRLDFSRQRLTTRDLAELYAMAQEKRMLENFRNMVAGQCVNVTEKRAALHTSLRSWSSDAPMIEQVREGRKRILDFARQIREGIWRGCRGERITDVINVGIGGSEKGPHAVYHALRSANQKIRVHFLSSVDGVLLERILDSCNPLTTLAVISSKSFSTRETLVNATAVDQWFLNAGIIGADRARHMVVVSANAEAAQQMCLPEENLFPLWKWVGGRFSVWGAVGLPIAIALGPEIFSEFRYKGALKWIGIRRQPP
ncbi:glucose-6-phosphate isomerase [gut metagenome]|uniref:Glucose-6-phosphate isomerase n=1 Tax=gut metagenome TaxID=749906 RepID=J9GK21_9ZZZZ